MSGGWNIDAEDWKEVDRMNVIDDELKLLVGNYEEVSVDPREVLITHNQGPVGSCFTAGHRVSMADGTLKPIEDVQVGERVLTHKNRSREVIDTMHRQYNGDLYDVHVKGWGKLRMTDDHLVRVFRDEKLDWIRADQLTTDDELIVPWLNENNASHVIDLSDYISDKNIIESDGKIRGLGDKRFIDRYIKVDKELCWVLGLFVAEGSTDKSGAGNVVRSTFTLHEKELEYGEKLIEFFSKFGIEVTKSTKKENKAVNWRVQSQVIAKFLESVCGKFCNHKKIPTFIMNGTEEQRLSFLNGYFAGDGCLVKAESRNQVHSTTTSKDLNLQVAMLFVSMKMKAAMTSSKKRSHQNFDSHHVYLYSNDSCKFVDKEYTYRGESGEQMVKNKLDALHSEEGQRRKISNINKIATKNTTVYDFTVAEDHSFVCEGILVHNCRGHSGSTTLEWLYCLSTGKIPTVTLSPAYFYYETQRIDGISGDKGSTISGGGKLMLDKGCCINDLWPYQARYNNRRPANFAEIQNNASQFKVKRIDRLDSYDAIRTFLGSGIGGVDCGISWSSAYSQPIVESFRGGSGGHAIALPALSERKDRQGRPYVYMLNSHGNQSGRRGWSEWSPNAIEQMCRHRWSVFIGVSDMADVKPRFWSKEEYIGIFV